MPIDMMAMRRKIGKNTILFAKLKFSYENSKHYSRNFGAKVKRWCLKSWDISELFEKTHKKIHPDH